MCRCFSAFMFLSVANSQNIPMKLSKDLQENNPSPIGALSPPCFPVSSKPPLHFLGCLTCSALLNKVISQHLKVLGCQNVNFKDVFEI